MKSLYQWEIVKKSGVSALLTLLLITTTRDSAYANPELSGVASGNVVVTQAQNSTHVQQQSQQAILEWKNFNIGAGEQVHFEQPENGIALNRINPNQGASQIYGQLTATGKIILINAAGIYFGTNAYVDVGSLIASTADISNENFLAGKYLFNQASTLNGAIINDGRIIAAQHGLLALLGTGIVNNGLILAKRGEVILASGNTFTLDFYGDQLINFSVAEGAAAAGQSADGSLLKDGIKQSGTIFADGGSVLLTAKTAEGILDNAINMDGVIQANSVSSEKGSIILAGGDHNKVTLAGKIEAAGKNAGENGGKITVTGKAIHLQSATNINTNGVNAGGEILIGGDYQGKGILPHAKNIAVDAGATISANSQALGDGGKIVLWADDTTLFHGAISATGGIYGGNGGLVETSGHVLDIQGSRVNLLAAKGNIGTWLLDPTDLVITNTNNPHPATPEIVVSDLVTALQSANVLLQTAASGTGGNGDITVNAPINWSGATQLTLSAYRNITLNANIENTGNGSIILRADNTGLGAGKVSATNGHYVNLNGGTGNVKIYYNPTIFGTSETIYTGGTTPIAYMLINNLTQLQNINSNLSNNYALGTNIDAAATSSWNSGAGFLPLGTNTTPFSGNFDGQQYAISNLYINRNGVNQIGLFGTVTGSISNVGVTNVSINAINSDGVGALAGRLLNGRIYNSYSTGNLANSGSMTVAGGLVGFTSGSSAISQSFSAVNVTGVNYVGGLVGINCNLCSTGNTSTIINSYATGNVFGSGSGIGGLVGANGGTGGSPIIINSFSTGYVRGGSSIGGLVGSNTGSIINSFWNSETSGLTTSSASSGAAGYRGMTTAQMMQQSNFTTGSSFINGTGWDFTSTWGIIAGQSFPYASAIYAETPRAISGTTNAAANTTLSLAVNGSLLTAGALTQNYVKTGVNGFYYFLQGKNVIADNDALLIYLPSGANGGSAVTLAPTAGGSISGFNIATNKLSIGDNNSNTLSNSILKIAAGNLSATDILYSITGSTPNTNLLLGSASNTSVTLTTTANTTYTVDGGIGLGNGAINNTLLFNGAVIINNGTNNITSTGSQTYNSTTTLLSDAILIGTDISLNSITGGGKSLTINTTGNSTIAGIFSGTNSSLIKLGSGTLNLNAANTYTGITNLSAGVLQTNIANAFANSSQFTLANLSNTTFNLNNYNQSIQSLTGGGANGGNISLGSAILTITQKAAGTFAGVISGTGSLSLGSSSSAILTLSGDNTYSGITTLNGGTLSIDSDLRLGTAPLNFISNSLTFNGGTLATTSSFTLNNNRGITINAGGATINTASGTVLTYIGTTSQSNISGSGSLSKAGNGSLLLNSVNTYTGQTNINAGTLQIGTNNAIASGNAINFANTAGAILDLNNFSHTFGTLAGGGTTGGNILLGAATLTIGNSSSSTYGGAISGTGGLIKQGSGTLTLNNTNSSYTGQTIINAGTLNVAKLATAGLNSSIGAASGSAATIVLGSNAAATLSYTGGTGSTDRPISLGGTGGGTIQTTASGTLSFLTGATVSNNGYALRFATNSGNINVADVISGSGSLTKSGNGTLTLSHVANTYTGQTIITAGTLQATKLADSGVNSSIGAASGSASTILLGSSSTGTLAYIGSSDSTDRIFTLSGSGGGGINSSAAGLLTLTGAINTASSPLTVTTNNNITISGPISGNGTLNKSGSSVLLLTGANSYTGMTSINGGTLRLGSTQGILSGNSLILANAAGAVFDLNNYNQVLGSLAGGGTSGGNISLGSATLTVGDSSSTTYAGIISGSGNLIKQGAGSLTLSSINSSYTGQTIINQGTLSVTKLASAGSNSSIGAASGTAATILLGSSNAAILSYIGSTGATDRPIIINGTGGGTIQALSGSLTLSAGATISNSGNNLTFDTNAGNITVVDIISGAGNLTKTGSGILTLSNSANTYTGQTIINNGILSVSKLANAGSTSSLGAATGNAATILLGSNTQAMLSYTGSSDITDRPISLNGSGGGKIQTTQTGLLTLAGNINNNGYVLAMENNGNLTASGVISGTGALAKYGDGLLKLSAENTYSGNTTIYSGILQLGIAHAIGSDNSISLANTAGVTFDLNNFSHTFSMVSGGGTVGGNISLGSATLTINNNTDITYAGLISGTGGLIKQGAGALTLSNTNSSYTGQTAIAAGSLKVAKLSSQGQNSSIGAASGNAATILLGSNAAATLSYLGNNDSTNRAIKINGLGGGTIETNGGNLSLLPGATIENNGYQLTLATTQGNLSIADVISGAGALTKIGNSILTLSNTANTYTGQTSIMAGTLVASKLANAGSNSSLGAASGENASILLGSSSAATLSYTGGTDTSNRAITVNGNGGGTIQATTNGLLTLTGPLSTASYGLILDTQGGNISIDGTISGQGSLSKINEGTLILNNLVTVGSMISSGGSTILNHNISTSNSQLFNNAVIVGGDVTLSTDNNAISFMNTINGTGKLTLSSGSGAINLVGNIGEISALSAFTTNSTGTITVKGNIHTQGNQIYNGALSLTGNTLLDTGSNHANTLSLNKITGNGFDLTLNNAGNTLLNDTISGVANLTTDASGVTKLSGNITSQTLTFNDDIFLNNAIGLTANGGEITFAGTLNGAYDLVLASNVAVNFNNHVGNQNALTSLDILGATQINGATISTTGNQNYRSAIKLLNDTTLASSQGAINFSGDITGNANLTVNSASTTTIHGIIGSVLSPLKSLTLNSAQTDMHGGAVTTTGSQVYKNLVTISSHTTLTSTENGSIVLNNGVAGANKNLYLAGGTGSNTFSLKGNIAVQKLEVSGGTAGNNTLSVQSNHAAQTWMISSHDRGNIDGISEINDNFIFTNIQNLIGGDHNDTFILQGGTLSGSVNGGLGNNTLIGDNINNVWHITNNNSGTVTGVSGNFSNIANLKGGTIGSNDFIFANNASISGSIDGGNLTSTASLDYTAYSTPLNVTLSDDYVGYSQNSNNNMITNFSNIQNINSSKNSTLTLTNSNKHNLLVITGPNQGYALDPVSFSGFTLFNSPYQNTTVLFDTESYLRNANTVAINNNLMRFFGMTLSDFIGEINLQPVGLEYNAILSALNYSNNSISDSISQQSSSNSNNPAEISMKNNEQKSTWVNIDVFNIQDSQNQLDLEDQDSERFNTNCS